MSLWHQHIFSFATATEIMSEMINQLVCLDFLCSYSYTHVGLKLHSSNLGERLCLIQFTVTQNFSTSHKTTWKHDWQPCFYWFNSNMRLWASLQHMTNPVITAKHKPYMGHVKKMSNSASVVHKGWLALSIPGVVQWFWQQKKFQDPC